MLSGEGIYCTFLVRSLHYFSRQGFLQLYGHCCLLNQPNTVIIRYNIMIRPHVNLYCSYQLQNWLILYALIRYSVSSWNNTIDIQYCALFFRAFVWQVVHALCPDILSLHWNGSNSYCENSVEFCSILASASLFALNQYDYDNWVAARLQWWVIIGLDMRCNIACNVPIIIIFACNIAWYHHIRAEVGSPAKL